LGSIKKKPLTAIEGYMNSTAAATTVAAQVAVPLVGGIVAPMLSWAVYRVARRRLKHKQTLQSKSHVFYRVISAVLLGEFVCHSMWTTLGATWISLLCVAAGYALFTVADGWGTVWNTNVHYVGAAAVATATDEIVMVDRMEEPSIVAATNLTSPEFATQTWALQHKAKDKRKRQWMLATLIAVLIMVTVKNGLALAASSGGGGGQLVALIACTYVNGISLSIAVYGAMLHAKFHVTEQMRLRIIWWCAVTALWCVTLLCAGSVPLLLLSGNGSAVVSSYFIYVYAVCVGVVIAVQQYYHAYSTTSATSKRETLMGLFVFLLTLAQSVVTSAWL
jgi:hypothetical protein